MSSDNPIRDLMYQVIERARDLADLKMDELRSSFPELTNTQNELIRRCKDEGYTRGQLIKRILQEEFENEVNQLDSVITFLI